MQKIAVVLLVSSSFAAVIAGADPLGNWKSVGLDLWKADGVYECRLANNESWSTGFRNVGRIDVVEGERQSVVCAGGYTDADSEYDVRCWIVPSAGQADLVANLKTMVYPFSLKESFHGGAILVAQQSVPLKAAKVITVVSFRGRGMREVQEHTVAVPDRYRVQGVTTVSKPDGYLLLWTGGDHGPENYIYQRQVLCVWASDLRGSPTTDPHCIGMDDAGPDLRAGIGPAGLEVHTSRGSSDSYHDYIPPVELTGELNEWIADAVRAAADSDYPDSFLEWR